MRVAKSQQWNCPVCDAILMLTPYWIIRKRYCSKKCTGIGARVKKHTIKCVCGKQISVSEKSNKKYCNIVCKANAKRIHSKKLNINCHQCSKKMVVQYCNRYAKYCSRVCVAKSQERKKKIKCKQCKNFFLVHKHINEQIYCGISCYTKSRQNLQKIIIFCQQCKEKIKSPNWVGQKYCKKQCQNLGMRGFKHSLIARQNMHNGQQNQSEETKMKRRLAKIRYIEKTKNDGVPISPTIGRNETKLLNNIEKKLGIKIIRQFRVFGYFVDGYDKKNNVVYEIDEKHHVGSEFKDFVRQQNIMKVLKCEFIRIKDYV